MCPSPFEMEYRIHYYDVNSQKKASITSLLNYFNDIAFVQSEKMGVGIDYLKENNLAWVLLRWDVKVDRYPLFNEKIIIKTEPYFFKKFYAYRWFDIKNNNGLEIVNAKSQWILINPDKKRPVKINDYIYKVYNVNRDKNDVLPIEDPKELSNVDLEKQFDVRYCDLDTNHHVNNVKYVSWALEAIPLEIILNYTLHRLKVRYEKETTYGKTIKVLSQAIPDQENIIYLQKIVDEDGNKLCLLESFFKGGYNAYRSLSNFPKCK